MKLSYNDFKVYEHLLVKKIGILKEKAKDALVEKDEEKADETVFTIYNLMIIHEFASQVCNMGDAERFALEWLEKGERVKAIKAYRQYTGLGLKEAKEAVDALDIERKKPGFEFSKALTPTKNDIFNTMFNMIADEVDKRNR